MKANDKKKFDQLGMPIGTASNRLRKLVIFSLLKKLGENFCFQCGAEIESEEDLSIEHKIPYLDSENPKSLFFDIDNIAFSHLTCNCGAARQTRIRTHGLYATYNNTGCRCDDCRKASTLRKQRQRKALKAHVEVAPDS